MNKKLLVILTTITILTAGSSWHNQSQIALAKSQKTKFQLPANAIQIADDLYSLGSTFDKQSGKQVEGYAIIHRKNTNAKPGGANKPTASACYGFLAKDAKWKGIPESWLINPTNTRGINPTFVLNNLTTDIAKWETAAAFDILGAGTSTEATLTADNAAPDGLNEVYFADIADPNTIAITIIWGTFGGPTFNRQLVEWDQVYDDTTFDWSATGEAAKMDFENIATHELGHAVGMGDLYNASCSNETMYGYATEGETKKRDLNIGDITGINKLY